MKTCPKCKTIHLKDGVFCSRHCANSRKWSLKDKQKKSVAAKNSSFVLTENKFRKRNLIEKIELMCEQCKQTFFVFPSEKKRHYCSKNCYYQCPNKQKFFKKKVGGYRKNSGRGKQGWYKGYYCNSSWELAWVVYQLEHGLKFQRNTKGFEYVFDNKKHEFFPDFQIDSTQFYVEVKGYMDRKNIAKLTQFPHKLEVLGKVEIQPFLEYVIKKYGSNFVSLYE